jgi:hydrogenase maturation protease
MTTRIVCVGNRFVPADRLGPAVFDELASRALPGDVEVVDGGLRGLDLLGVVERSSRVVFVDALAAGVPGEVVVLDAVGAAAPVSAGGHDAGLDYLLRCLPHVCDAPPPWCLVGAAGAPDADLVGRVASRAIALAGGGAP